MRDDCSALLIDRLAASIVDESLPLKDVEKELRGCVAEVAVKKRGLGKREIANRCGVTEKSIDNYLKEARANPKSPEREIARLLQDGPLTLEEIYDAVRPILCHGRYFTLDDAKRALDKLIRTGEAEALSGKRYRGSNRPAIRMPLTIDAYRDLVDEKARDLDYVILSQKEISEDDLPKSKTQQFSRVVGDTNLIRIDFTADVGEEELPRFYERLSAEIARLTLKYERKKGGLRVRVLVGMRAVALLLAALAWVFVAAPGARADGGAAGALQQAGDSRETWELDNRGPPPAQGGDEKDDPAVDRDPAIGPPDADSSQDRRELPVVFIRGDATLDRLVDISDVLVVLMHLYQGFELSCADAADVNDDGWIDLADPVQLVRHLFASGEGTEGLGTEGADTTPDRLDCKVLR